MKPGAKTSHSCEAQGATDEVINQRAGADDSDGDADPHSERPFVQFLGEVMTSGQAQPFHKFGLAIVHLPLGAVAPSHPQ